MNRLTHPVPTVRKRAPHSRVDVLLSHDATWLAALTLLIVALGAVLARVLAPVPAPEQFLEAWLFGGAGVLAWLLLRLQGP